MYTKIRLPAEICVLYSKLTKKGILGAIKEQGYFNYEYCYYFLGLGSCPVLGKSKATLDRKQVTNDNVIDTWLHSKLLANVPHFPFGNSGILY